MTAPPGAGEKKRSRLFLAVFPPSDVQEAAFAALAAVRRPGDGVSWVKRENLHYTLRFLGELGEDGARRAGEAALEAAADLPPFEAALGALGAFPDARRARVIWIGLSRGEQELVALARGLEAALKRRGFGPPDRPFRAHLTLGRVRGGEQDWSANFGAASPPPAHFTFERLGLIESRLSPKGSVYAVRLEAQLSPPRPIA